MRLIVSDPGWTSRIATVITLTGGTMLMWLGEQITQRGIGNGISLMSGIVAELPSAIAGTLGRQGALSTGLILTVLVMSVAHQYEGLIKHSKLRGRKR
jgi:preprotein translocase subunit SecY